MATINADSLSSTDVQSAINSASDGDTVVLPSGSATWTSGVTISGKGIKVQGAGGGRVEGSSTSSLAIGTGSKSFTIRSGSVVSSGWTNGETVTARHKFNASNYMTGTVTSWNGTTLVLNIASTGGSGTQGYWVFDMPATTTITHNAGSGVLFTVTDDASHHVELCDMRLVEGTGSGYGITVGGTTGGKPFLLHDIRITNIHQGVRFNVNRGIIWRFYADAGFNISSDYTNNDNAIQIVETTGDSWTTADTLGDNDTNGTTNVYIEDSYFCGIVLGCVDCGDNARVVIRNSVLDNSSLTIHGYDTDPIGCRHLEVYDVLGVFHGLPDPGLSANMNYWVTWRGGSGVVVDNELDDVSSWAWGNKVDVTLEYQALRRPSGYDNSCYAGGYPAPRQPGQGHNGSASVTEGVYFGGNNRTLDCSPIDYSPDGCGGGQAISTFIQQDRDYFLTEKSGYAKYSYPHPLRGGAMLGGPQNVRWRPA